MAKPSNHRRCRICGHEWTVRVGNADPKRCPKEKCRSPYWKTGKAAKRQQKENT